MNSFSSASQMCDPLPRTIKGGCPPTEPNARTGEFTPPGIMLSARCCKRRDCSVLRDVVDGIESSRLDMISEKKDVNRKNATDYYSSAPKNQIHQIFILLQPSCNMPRVPSSHQAALLTGRV